MKNQIAYCIHPTTVLFIDDREPFLKNLAGSLLRSTAFKMHTDPEQALKEIKKYRAEHITQPIKLTDVTGKYAGEYVPEQAHLVVDIDASNIYPTIYDQDRFKTIAVVVVDYAMPDINGLDFARQLKAADPTFIKILMLTGEANESLAVKAFNEGVIDKFIRKDSTSYIKELNDSIAELQNDYFYKASQGFISSLSTNKDCCLNDPVFIKFFNDLCQEKNICEYYLADEMGSFLLADPNGETFGLIVNSENMLHNYATVALDDSATPKNITKALQNKEKVLFLFTNQNLYLPVSAWNKYLYPATKLVGQKNNYYYSVVPGNKIKDFQPKKVVSYGNYLRNLQPC